MQKNCSKCEEKKPLSEFFRSGKQPSGKEKFRGDCKQCASADTTSWRKKNRVHYNSYMGKWRTQNPDKIRAIDMKRNYGITLDQYVEMVRIQKGGCKICGKEPQGKRPLAIDHDHHTGKIRGLLCYRCNTALALLDDPDRLKRSIAYLNQ